MVTSLIEQSNSNYGHINQKNLKPLITSLSHRCESRLYAKQRSAQLAAARNEIINSHQKMAI